LALHGRPATNTSGRHSKCNNIPAPPSAENLPPCRIPLPCSRPRRNISPPAEGSTARSTTRPIFSPHRLDARPATSAICSNSSGQRRSVRASRRQPVSPRCISCQTAKSIATSRCSSRRANARIPAPRAPVRARPPVGYARSRSECRRPHDQQAQRRGFFTFKNSPSAPVSTVTIVTPPRGFRSVARRQRPLTGPLNQALAASGCTSQPVITVPELLTFTSTMPSRSGITTMVTSSDDSRSIDISSTGYWRVGRSPRRTRPVSQRAHGATPRQPVQPLSLRRFHHVAGVLLQRPSTLTGNR